MPVLPDGDERPSKQPGDRELKADAGDNAEPGDPNGDDGPEGKEGDEEWVPA